MEKGSMEGGREGSGQRMVPQLSHPCCAPVLEGESHIKLCEVVKHLRRQLRHSGEGTNT